jgi:hypothetical protein
MEEAGFADRLDSSGNDRHLNAIDFLDPEDPPREFWWSGGCTTIFTASYTSPDPTWRVNLFVKNSGSYVALGTFDITSRYVDNPDDPDYAIGGLYTTILDKPGLEHYTFNAMQIAMINASDDGVVYCSYQFWVDGVWEEPAYIGSLIFTDWRNYKPGVPLTSLYLVLLALTKGDGYYTFNVVSFPNMEDVKSVPVLNGMSSVIGDTGNAISMPYEKVFVHSNTPTSPRTLNPYYTPVPWGSYVSRTAHLECSALLDLSSNKPYTMKLKFKAFVPIYNDPAYTTYRRVLDFNMGGAYIDISQQSNGDLQITAGDWCNRGRKYLTFDSQYHTIHASFDGNTKFRLYVDDVLEYESNDSGSDIPSLEDSGETVYVWATGYTDFTNGVLFKSSIHLDEVIIYDQCVELG